MAHYDERLSGLDDRSRHDRPCSADGHGAPRAPRAYGRGLAWLWLGAGLGALLTGIVIGHGLLIAAGLVVSGVAGQLFDPQRRSSRGRVRRGGLPRTR
ncbi:hypothetical protein ACFWVP_23225 [Streptomyces sp. NPDC058637]|uniref:hypothetical protein n=1 Tax=Streptomyces sp. NPDC058637 TaxID=3346569 RepID=UPI00365C9798